MDHSWKDHFLAAQKDFPLESFPGRGGSIVVIAPHPDDDVLGAGGTMIAAAQKGKAVFSVYLTDGRGSPRLDPAMGDEEMALQRENEALLALKIAGAAGGFFLRGRSRDLEGEETQPIQGEMIEIFRHLQPQEVYLPAPYERHRTHQAGTRLALESLRSLPGLKPFLLGYSLWGLFWGGKKRVIRDISPLIRSKVEAVMAHASQIAYKAYQQGILGKNNYEAVFWASHETREASFVEIFLDMTELLEKPGLTLSDFVRQDVEAFIQDYLPGQTKKGLKG